MGTGGSTGGSDASGATEPRERIVAAARRRFLRYGFARCTMAELAAELGMSKKTLYQHFRSKEELVDELVTRKSHEMLAGFEAALTAPNLSFPERSARFFHHALTQFAEIDVAFVRDVRRFTPRIHLRIEEIRARNIPRLWENLLRSGIADGAVRADTDVATTVRIVLVAMQALLQPEHLEKFAVPPHEVMARFFDLTFAGLLTREGLADYEHIRSSLERGLPPV